MSTRTDSERLKWMCQSEAQMAFSRDGECCWLLLQPEEEDGRMIPQGSAYYDIRSAIDAAMDKEDQDAEAARARLEALRLRDKKKPAA